MADETVAELEAAAERAITALALADPEAAARVGERAQQVAYEHAPEVVVDRSDVVPQLVCPHCDEPARLVSVDLSEAWTHAEAVDFDARTVAFHYDFSADYDGAGYAVTGCACKRQRMVRLPVGWEEIDA